MQQYIKLLCMWLLCSMAICQETYAQSTPNYAAELPSLLPPSPEVGALIKAGLGSVNYSTGAVSSNIPLYTLKVRDIQWPISIGYSSQGTKTDEATSRVGFGWNLNANGVITRVVRGQPDEKTAWSTPPGFMGDPTVANFNYANGIVDNKSFDTEADLFIYSFGPYSGKFYVERGTRRVIQTGFNNLKISVNASYSAYTITAPDGTRYLFGNGNVESTLNHNIASLATYKSSTPTGFFLYKVISPTGAYIDFNYSNINISVTAGISQTITWAAETPEDLNPGGSDCKNCPKVNSTGGGGLNVTNTMTSSRIEYSSKYLASISTSNGITVSFTHQPKPDLTGDNRISAMSVTSASGSLKSFQFTYWNVPGQDGNYASAEQSGQTVKVGRFFLTKLTEIESVPSATPGVWTLANRDYFFDYYDKENVVKPVSPAQDYFGFANGNNTNSYLEPYEGDNFGLAAVANKKPDPNIAQKGMLRSIVYPTGGKEEFIYEANTIPGENLRNTRVPIYLSGTNANGTAVDDVFTTFFYSRRAQKASITYASTWDSLAGVPTAQKWMQVVILAKDSIIFDRTTQGEQSINDFVKLEKDKEYIIRLIIKTGLKPASGNLAFVYDTAATDIYDRQNLITGGLRVKEIRMTDSYTGKSTSKYYKYAHLSNLSNSSGMGNTSVNYKTGSGNLKICGWDHIVCRTHVYSTNTSYGNFNFNGSHINYKSIIESTDPNFKTGGTMYEFYDPQPASTTQEYWGGFVPNLPEDAYETMTGKIYKTTWFDSSFFVLREKIDDYEAVGGDSGFIDNHYITRRWDARVGVLGIEEQMQAFHIVGYRNSSKWNRLKTTTTRDYDRAGNVMTNQIDYTYNNRLNAMPSSMKSINSKGQETIVTTTYATDYPSDPFLAKMARRNYIEMPVEESSYLAGTLMQQKQTAYTDVNNDSTIYRPAIVKIKSSPNDVLQAAIQYEKFDSSGNPLQLRKVDDMAASYIWDYNRELVIAEVKGATVDQIAFTSFETDALGNWNKTTGNRILGGFFSDYAFTGTLTKTISKTGNYTVTLWTKSSATVNSTAGTLLKTKGAWKLYSYALTNPTTITIVGTQIDEVKLAPKNTPMLSYTHKPQFGLLTQSDANNNYMIYEYDPNGRLYIVRDIDSNIVKKNEYSYMTPLYAHDSAVWIATGTTRCKPCAIAPEFVGDRSEKEMRDMNVRSATYNQTRWDDNGASSSCGTCPIYKNDSTFYAVFQQTSCGEGAGSYITYIIRNGTVYSNISVADANAKAKQRVQTEGYAFTNSLPCGTYCNGIFIPPFVYKCIDNVRTNAQMIYNPGEFDTSINKWICSYYYLYQDGTRSIDFYTVQTVNCLIEM